MSYILLALVFYGLLIAGLVLIRWLDGNRELITAASLLVLAICAICAMVVFFLGCTQPLLRADLDRDGDVDLADYASFADQFAGPPGTVPAQPPTAVWLCTPLAEPAGWWQCILKSGGVGLVTTYYYAQSPLELRRKLSAVAPACVRAEISILGEPPQEPSP